MVCVGLKKWVSVGLPQKVFALRGVLCHAMGCEGDEGPV